MRTIEQLLWYVELLEQKHKRADFDEAMSSMGVAHDYYYSAKKTAKELIRESKSNCE